MAEKTPATEGLADTIEAYVFEEPYNRDYNPLVAYTWGSSALFDLEGGMRQQVWECRWVNNSIVLSAPNGADVTLLQGVQNVTRVAFALDSRMRPVIAYTVGPTIYVRRFVSLTESDLNKSITNSRTPVLVQGYPYDPASLNNIIHLFYIEEGDNVHVGMYRTVDENDLSSPSQFSPTTGDTAFNNKDYIHRVGFTTERRLQIEIARISIDI